MNQEIISILEDIGLSEKEVAVYLALLQLGEETASRISEIAKLNRITTYTLLKSLQEKGFCSVFEKNKVQYFKPLKPEHIMGLLEEKKDKIKTIVPLLKQKEKTVSEKPEVMLFEGKKGILSALNIIINDSKKNKEVLGYGNFTIADRLIEYESIYWRKTRIINKIKMKAVINTKKGTEVHKEIKDYGKFTQIKELKELEKTTSYSLISKNYVGIIAGEGELHGVLIKDKAIVEKEKFIFDLLWRQAKK